MTLSPWIPNDSGVPAPEVGVVLARVGVEAHGKGTWVVRLGGGDGVEWMGAGGGEEINCATVGTDED